MFLKIFKYKKELLALIIIILVSSCTLKITQPSNSSVSNESSLTLDTTATTNSTNATSTATSVVTSSSNYSDSSSTTNAGEDTIAPIITINPDTVFIYSKGDTYKNYGCTALDDKDGHVSCEVTGLVNTSRIGEYTIEYKAKDLSNNEAKIEKKINVFSDASLVKMTLIPYYSSVQGLFGEELLLNLRRIINQDFVKVSYGDIRSIMPLSDVDPNNSNNVLCIYNHSSVSKIWDGSTYTREHVWPNSRLGVSSVANTTKNIASDAHNLRAIIQSINSSRSNKMYDTTTTTSTYNPQYDKGQVARIIFYMYTMYDTLKLTDEIVPDNTATNYKPEGAIMGRISVLLQWHLLEPVDNFEKNRNEVIYSYQKNRNPFIDYPHFIELIFYNSPYYPN